MDVFNVSAGPPPWLPVSPLQKVQLWREALRSGTDPPLNAWTQSALSVCWMNKWTSSKVQVFKFQVLSCLNCAPRRLRRWRATMGDLICRQSQDNLGGCDSLLSGRLWTWGADDFGCPGKPSLWTRPYPRTQLPGDAIQLLVWGRGGWGGLGWKRVEILWEFCSLVRMNHVAPELR